jgi:ketohexokinase
MATILAIGIATLDIINVVESYPEEDSELRAISQQQARGGNATNTLTVLSQLGHHCVWGGVLIDEPDSHTIKQDLANSSIDTSFCNVLASGKMPTSYITLNKQSGSRSIVHHRDCPEFNYVDFLNINLDTIDWLHFEGRNIAETDKMLQHVKQYYPDLPCSLEIEKSRANIESLFALPDVLLFSQSYAESCGYHNAHDFLESLSHHTLSSCAWGRQGAWARSPQGDIYHSDAFPPAILMDTLGAGDTFNAGFIHSLIEHKSPQQALSYACQLAGHKCGQYGFSNLITHDSFQR